MHERVNIESIHSTCSLNQIEGLYWLRKTENLAIKYFINTFHATDLF